MCLCVRERGGGEEMISRRRKRTLNRKSIGKLGVKKDGEGQREREERRKECLCVCVCVCVCEREREREREKERKKENKRVVKFIWD